MRHTERDKIANAATSAGADYLGCVLLTPSETAISRHRHREHHIDQVLEALVSATVIEQSHARITACLTGKTTVIDATGNADQTYATLIEVLAEQLN